MTPTNRSKYVPGYDLFKLIVAVILTLILIALLMRGSQLESVPVVYTASVSSPTAMKSITATLPTAIETLKPVTLTPEPSPTASSTVEPSATASLTAEPSATAIPPTSTPVPSPTATPTPSPAPTQSIPTSDPNACPSDSSRVHAGDILRVLVRLNLRKGPGLNWPIILTNNPGTRLEVIGGPVCVIVNTSEGPRSYLWWNVRMQNGQEGWSAEAPLISPYYFLEPIR
jgi:hypothetical protein